MTNVNKKTTILRVFFDVYDVSYTDIGSAVTPPVTRVQVGRVATERDPSNRIRAEIIKRLGLPEDFFVTDYEMTITLKKKEVKAA